MKQMTGTCARAPRNLPALRMSALALALGGALHVASARADVDLSDISLEQLLDTPVYSASKFVQKASDAPASVTVVTAEDFRQYGWRTLADMVRSLRGFSITRDRQYSYVGVRGFARSGDYNSRLLVLIDGYRVNDNVYDSGFIDTELPLDVDLIERVEIVRGPSSSIYGGNALFGVINIVTRGGGSVDGVQAAASLASHRTRQGRLTYGKRLSGNDQLLLSMTLRDSRGPHLSFADIDPSGAPLDAGAGRDFNHGGQFFGKLTLGALTLTAGASERRKGLATGAFGVVLDDGRNRIDDVAAFVSAEQQWVLAPGHEAALRLAYSRYDYDGNYIYTGNAPGETIDSVDAAHGTWWNGELKLVSQLGAHHKLVYGLEWQQNLRQEQIAYDVEPFDAFLDVRRKSHRAGLYVQDEFRWSEDFTLSYGGRYDRYSGAATELNPRVAAVWRSTPATVWKLIYGSAFRPANFFESDYSFPDQQTAGGQLEPEKIRTLEGVVEHFLTPETQLLVSAYAYRMRDLIDLRPAPADPGLVQFQQVGGVRARGLEIGAIRRWENGASLRTSLSLQRGRDDQGNAVLGNPRRMFKFNGALPLPLAGLSAGMEFQATSARPSRSLDPDTGLERIRDVPGHAITNLTVSTAETAKGWAFSFGVYNLFDQRYRDPVGFDAEVPARDSIEQDGRTLRVKVSHRF